VATRGAGAACGLFGFALNVTATFDVFPGLQVTNDGLSYVVFESTPNGSDHADIWLFWIRAQTVPPNCFAGTLLAITSGQGKPKNFVYLKNA
jgi:hypothetical protein